MIKIINHLTQEIYGLKPMILEHGSVKNYSSSGNCIDHAHLHLFPANENVFRIIDALIPKGKDISAECLNSVGELHSNIPYLWVNNFNHKISRIYLKILESVPSQFLRKAFAIAVGQPGKWNWQSYIGTQEIRVTLNRYKEEWIKYYGDNEKIHNATHQTFLKE